MDTTTEQPTVPKNKGGRPHGSKNKPRAAAPKQPKDELFGVSVSDCCDACKPAACVITGKPYCGHPLKGGLHSAEQSNPAVLKRYSQAKRLLAEAKIRV